MHTAGPWEIIDGDSHDFSVSHDGNCDGAFEGLVASGYVVVGSVEDPALAVVVCDMNHINTWDDETLDANVALVTAAPDLLAALTAIDGMWSECDGERVDPAQARSPKVRDVWEVARAAIAKATGAGA